MKMLTILGARPQFIKAAAVSRAIAETPNPIQEIIVHTGQHFDHNMSDIFFEEMGIPKANYHLGISGLNHGAMTGRMLEKIEDVLLIEKPDVVLVYGDTNSTLAGALAASKLHIPIAHVEAGLRSFNMKMPEEINRIVTDRLSRFLFCPTNQAMHNLTIEGFNDFACTMLKAGDVMQDAALFHAKQAKKPASLNDTALSKGYVLATLHRAESTDNPTLLKNIVETFNQLHQDDMHVVIPLHPRTANKLKESGLTLHCDVLAPASYLEMLYLIQNAQLVMTDSGGLQQEAYFFAKPCVTLRTETEWVELIEHGVNQLAPLAPAGIHSTFPTMKAKTVDTGNALYGDGRAAHAIVQAIHG